MRTFNRMNLSWLICGMFAMSFAVHASTSQGLPTWKGPTVLPPITQEMFDHEKQNAEARGRRTLASADVVSDLALSDSFLNLRSEIIGGAKYLNGKETKDSVGGIKTAEDLRAFLVKINGEYYDSLSPDAKFAAAQMAPLIAFQGFYNRSMDLLNSAQISHSIVVTSLRTFGSGVLMYFPTDQWTAGLKYLTMPTEKMGAPIANENDFHEFLKNELIPAMEKMRSRLEALNFQSKPIYFDNKILYGTANFFSDRDRYLKVSEAERKAALSATYYTMSGLYSLGAYNLSGLFKAVDKIGKAYGWGALIYNPEVSTSEERFKILKQQHAATGLFELGADGADWMNASYSMLQYAVANAKWSWTELKGRANDSSAQNNFLDPRVFAPGTRAFGAAFSNMQFMVIGSGPHKVSNAVVVNDTIRVDLENFYKHPPQSLTDLMPIAFDQSPYINHIELDGKQVEWHNYLNGRPLEWNLTQFQKCFPDVKSSDDVRATARVLAQAWGGWLLGIPMSALVL